MFLEEETSSLSDISSSSEGNLGFRTLMDIGLAMVILPGRCRRAGGRVGTCLGPLSADIIEEDIGDAKGLCNTDRPGVVRMVG